MTAINYIKPIAQVINARAVEAQEFCTGERVEKKAPTVKVRGFGRRRRVAFGKRNA